MPVRTVITVRQLIEFDFLTLRVIAGEGGLDHPISWAHVNELPDPTEWLDGGELLMTTGLGIPRRPRDQTRYLERLAEKRVAGLAIADQMNAPPLSRSFVARADALDLPVLFVYGNTPFVAISQAVAAANRDVLSKRFSTHLRVYETLGDVARSGADLPQLFERLTRISGYELHPVTPHGSALFPEIPPPPFRIPDELLAEALEQSMVKAPTALDLDIDPDDGQRVFLVPIHTKHRALGVLVAISREETEGSRVVLHHVATIVSLLAAELLETRERRRREDGERLSQLLIADDADDRDGPRPTLGDAFPDEPPAPACYAIVALVDDEDGWSELHHLLSEHGLRHAIARRSDRGVVMVRVGEATVDAVAGLLAAALPRSAIGASRALPAGTPFVKARREARVALQRALTDGRPVHVFDDSPAPRWLSDDPSTLAMIVDEILGPLIEHDRSTGSELVKTLAVVLEENRSWKVAAERLFVHRQTLFQRGHRIEQLTGRRLNRTEDVCDLWLALRSQQVLQRSGEPGSEG